MKKQLLAFSIALSTISSIPYILCMENKQINHSPHIISDIELTQEDINECTKELKEKYNDIGNMKKEDHELLREGIIDASIVIAQAKNNNTQELLSLRKKLYKQYKKLKPVGENPMDYDYLYGIMSINNTTDNKQKHEDNFSRLRRKESHQSTVRHDLKLIEKYQHKISKFILEKERFRERAHHWSEEIKIINLIQHIADLNQKVNFENKN